MARKWARVGRRAVGEGHRVQAEAQKAVEQTLSVVSHELRAPLYSARAGIQSYLGRLVPAEGADLLHRSLEEIDHSTGLLEALLRCFGGPGGLELRPTNIVRLVRQAALSAAGPRPDVVTVKGPPRGTARVEPELFRAAVENLVRNAVEHSPGEGTVDVLVERASGSIGVRVRDQGPGVPAHERDQIFDPFYRGSNARHRTGSGLGLFVTRRIVEAHNGLLTLESHGPGATFCIRIAS